MLSEVNQTMQMRHPEVEALLQVQEMDVEIMELQEQLNKYPSIWDEVKEQLRAKSAKLEALEQAEEKRKQERHKTEQELRISTDKLKQYQSQQMMVKTSKELTALGQQIDALKRTIARLEERGVELLEQDPKSAEEIQKARESLNETKDFAREERDRIRTQVKTKTKRIEEVRKQREKTAKTLSDDASDLYELTRKRWPDSPIVPVRNESCTGCHFTILPHKLVDLHKGEELLRCDNCGRILSYDESFEPTDTEEE